MRRQVSRKWAGRCDACGEWNAIVEEPTRPATPRGLGARQGAVIEFVPLAGSATGAPRLASGIAEFDRVTGGGLVAGSALLVGGDPGIGKSTMLLQVAGALADTVPVAYISGEEAVDQIRLRGAAARACRCPGPAGGRDQRPRYRHHAGERRGAAGGGGRFDPDDVCRHA